jgi:hypothetical protein
MPPRARSSSAYWHPGFGGDLLIATDRSHHRRFSFPASPAKIPQVRLLGRPHKIPTDTTTFRGTPPALLLK